MVQFGRENLESLLTELEMSIGYGRWVKLNMRPEDDGSLRLYLNHGWGKKSSLYWRGMLDEKCARLMKNGALRGYRIVSSDDEVELKAVLTRRNPLQPRPAPS